MSIFNNYRNLIIFILVSLIVLMQLFILQNIAYAADTIYDFSDEAQAKFDAQINKTETIKNPNNPKLKRSKKSNKQGEQYYQQDIKTGNDTYNLNNNTNYLVVKKGESFNAVLQSSISSASLDKNDTIAAALEEDWRYNGILIAPAGSILYGQVKDTQKASFLLRDGSMSIIFNELITPDGNRLQLASNEVTLKTNSEKGKRIIKNVAIGAIGGLVSGLLYTLMSGGDISSGIAIGASVGAAGGAVTTAFQHGADVEIPAGTNIRIELTQNMNAVPYK